MTNGHRPFEELSAGFEIDKAIEQVCSVWGRKWRLEMWKYTVNMLYAVWTWFRGPEWLYLQLKNACSGGLRNLGHMTWSIYLPSDHASLLCCDCMWSRRTRFVITYDHTVMLRVITFDRSVCDRLRMFTQSIFMHSCSHNQSTCTSDHAYSHNQSTCTSVHACSHNQSTCTCDRTYSHHTNYVHALVFMQDIKIITLLLVTLWHHTFVLCSKQSWNVRSLVIV